MKNAAIFVDVQNVYYTTRQAYQRHFNYNAFWQEISQRYNVQVAKAYAIQPQDPKQQQFQNILRGIGFELMLKPYIQRSDGSAKGDWDVGIALDVIEAAREYQHIILVSGDGDFSILLERCHRFDCQVEVYGVPSLTANQLIQEAKAFHPIEKHLLL